MNTKPPTESGRYLCCAYEWCGSEADKPLLPVWDIRCFDVPPDKRIVVPPPHPFAKETYRYEKQPGKWRKTEYRYDTGGMQNLHVVCWQPLPPLPGPATEPIESMDECIAKGLNVEEARAYRHYTFLNRRRACRGTDAIQS